MKRLIAVATAATLALGVSAAEAAPPVENYWTCKAVVHPHVHLSEPSKGHARKHRCRSVAVEPLAPEPERQVGPKPETPLEAHYRTRAQAAERRIQELGKELHAANSRTEQAREDGLEALYAERSVWSEKYMRRLGQIDQLKRGMRYLFGFLADTPEAEAARLITESVLDSISLSD